MSLFWGVFCVAIGFVFRFFYSGLHTLTPGEIGNLLKAEWPAQVLMAMVIAFLIMYFATKNQVKKFISDTILQSDLDLGETEKQHENHIEALKGDYEKSTTDLLAKHEKELAVSNENAKMAGQMQVITPMAQLMTRLISRHLKVLPLEIEGNPQRYEVFPNPDGGRIICFQLGKEHFQIRFSSTSPKLVFTPGPQFKLNALIPFPENVHEIGRIRQIFTYAKNILERISDPTGGDGNTRLSKDVPAFLDSLESIHLSTTDTNSVSPTLKPVIE